MHALHMASLAGHVECCRKLLQYGKIWLVAYTTPPWRVCEKACSGHVDFPMKVRVKYMIGQS